jgi:hypothetical protein
METRTGGMTVSITPGEVIPPWEAEIVEVPAATPVTTPEALMVAAAGEVEFHVTSLVRFCVV